MIANPTQSTPNSKIIMQQQGQQHSVEKRLQEALEKRAAAQTAIKTTQEHLTHLISRIPKQRPRERISELEAKINALERKRTLTSMKLSDEKDILKQIHKCERTKKEVQDFEAQDAEIKKTKAQVVALRESLRSLGAEISLLREEYNNVKMASQLNCKLEDLVGIKVDCPKDKIGNVIGRKGKKVKEFMEKANVTVDRDGGDVRIIGPLNALDQVVSDLDKVISETEETIQLPANIVNFLSTKNISAITEVRLRNPNVRFSVPRAKTEIAVRGAPSDIEALKNDLNSLEIVERELKVTGRECALIIGKQGATVEMLVRSHQAGIEVERAAGDDTESSIKVFGPEDNVLNAVSEIEEMLLAHKEITRSISIDPNAKAALLLNSGQGIKDIQKKLNEKMKEFGTSYAVNFGADGIIVKGKAAAMDRAVEFTEEEVHTIESRIVRIEVDPIAIPALIGKGGEGIKKVKDGKNVNIEADRKNGEIVVCGMNSAEVAAVVESIKGVFAENVVERINVDPSVYAVQFRDVIRVKSKELAPLAFLTGDDDKCQIVLRGKPEDLKQAVDIVMKFLDENYTEEIQLSSEDLRVLLAGGKDSKIEEFSKEHGVNLRSNRSALSLAAKGKKENVEKALAALKVFLYGGDGICVEKISLDDELLGIVIGKGGKKKDDLQKKFSNVTIAVHRGDNFVTLRGPADEVSQCRQDILRLIASARVTKKLELSGKQMAALMKKGIRRIIQAIPVQITQTETSIEIRGSPVDVHDAHALLREVATGVYEVDFEIEPSLFRRVKDACKQSSHLTRIQSSSGATLKLDEEKKKIVITGKRDKVTSAKIEIMRLLSFVLEKNFARLESSARAMVAILKSNALIDAAVTSSAAVRVDRDTSSIIVMASEAANLNIAVEKLKPIVEEGSKLVYLLQLDESEDWLVSSIIGKNGTRIKQLRKQCGCSIDVESKVRLITISADSAETVAVGKAQLLEIVEKERSKCAFVKVPDPELRSFVGKGGSHITEFGKEHNVEVQILKNLGSIVRITGEPDAVSAAKKAAEEWLQKREDERSAAMGVATVSLRRDQIPAIIGTKGMVVQSLQDEFKCRVDIDRNTSTVTVKGGTPETRAAAVQKIHQILASEDSDIESAAADLQANGAETNKAEKRSDSKKTSPNGRERQKEQESKPASFARGVKPQAKIAPSDFPELSSAKKSANGNSSSATTEAPSTSWASMVSASVPAPAEDTAPGEAVPRRSKAVVRSQQDWDATSVASAEGTEIREVSIPESIETH